MCSTDYIAVSASDPYNLLIYFWNDAACKLLALLLSGVYTRSDRAGEISGSVRESLGSHAGYALGLSL